MNTTNVNMLNEGDIILYQNKRFIFERAKKTNVLAVMEGTNKKYNLRIPPNNEFTVAGKSGVSVKELTTDKYPTVAVVDVAVGQWVLVPTRTRTELFKIEQHRHTRSVLASPLTGDRFTFPMSTQVTRLTEVLG